MSKKRLAPVVLVLLCATGAHAQESDREVWLTIGSEALVPMQATFRSAGLGAPVAAHEKNGVTVVRMRESQLPRVGKLMHDKFNRCAGFLVHDSQEEAVAAAETHATAAIAPPSPSLLASYALDNAATVNGILAQQQASNIVNTITTLSSYPTRYYTSQTGVDAANWVKNTWAGFAQGRSDVTVELFSHVGYAQPSVILTIQGGTIPNEVVVLGGHLDSINSGSGNAPGADDDASGIASLTEALRAAMAVNYRPARTVKFMAYAAEEVGLRGSKDIATSFKNNAVNVVGVLQLDMTNYRGSSVDVGMVTDNTNAAQNQFVTNLLDTYVGATWANTTCGYACSDHASWNSAGFPASMPFEALMNQHNQQIHTVNDTIAQSAGTATHALKFSKLAAAFMAELADGTINGLPLPPPPVDTTVTATYDATLKAPKCATVGGGCTSGNLLNGRAALGPETNAPNTINASCADGTSGGYHSDESNDRIKVSTTDGTNLAAGKQVTVEATAWVFSTSADRLELYYAANANSPSWTLIGTLTPPGTGSQTMSATYTLPSGSLQAVRARFRYQGTAGACGTGAYDDHDDLVFAVEGGNVPSDTTAPTASLTAPAAGATVSGTTTLTASASDNVGVTRVEFFVDGVLKGTANASPYSSAWDTRTASNGTHALVAKAYDAAGNVGTSTSVSVTVSNVSATAVYDAALKAPKCATVGALCDSGTLLNGRGTRGPETNAPNTINSSCADGNGGTYHSDESNDRIKVSTVDGTALKTGKQVKIEATVWAYSTASSDKLDLYYAANANSPSWVFIGTLTPPAGGAQTLSATYTLPTGSLQAVRARFRYQGSAGACGTGSYDDHDDLVFAVSP
jgi:leucyl aminopeptidase